jgi:SEC-C motif-containing protein
MTMTSASRCPCGSGNLFVDCCGPLLAGQRTALTAEALMRSRYTAYIRAEIGYLLATWHPTTRPPSIDAATIPAWCGLTILRTERGRAGDAEGRVEFRATGRVGNELVHLHEISRFVWTQDQWQYVEGELIEDRHERTAVKTGRNSLCPCGSGKKFKRCCAP